VIIQYLNNKCLCPWTSMLQPLTGMPHFDPQTGEAMEAEEDTPNDNINDM